MAQRAPGIDVSPARLTKVFSRVRDLVLVTGTNGKTTTAHLIEQILARAGRFPIRNRDGANLVPGLVATLSRAFFARRRPVVLEVDEGSLGDVVPPARPSLFVVTNVFRDQLDRYGEVDAVSAEIRQALLDSPADCTVVANADDPAVAALAQDCGRPTVFFGLEHEGEAGLGPSADSVLCPRCSATLFFAHTYLSHLGHYRCPRCGFARPTPDVGARARTGTGAGGTAFALDGVETSTPLAGTHGLYNAVAALAAARVLRIPDALALDVVRTARPMPGRSEWIDHRGRRVFLALAKNPAGFEAATRTLAALPAPRRVLLLLNDRWADGHDVSWIWDADFAGFRGDRVWVGGTRAEALTLRLKYAGAAPPLAELPPHRAAFDAAIAATPKGETLCVVLNYTAMLDLFRALRKPLVPR